MNQQHGAKLFIALFLLSLILLIRLFWTYISAIVLAMIIASVFYPVYGWVRKMFKERVTAAALFMILLIFLVLVVPLGWFVGALSNQAFDFYNRTRDAVSIGKIQETLESDSVWMQRLRKAGKAAGVEFTPEKVQELATSLGKNVGLFLYKQLSSVASNLLSFLIHFFLMMLVIYYLFRDGGRLKNYLTQLVPLPREQLEKVTGKFQEMGRAIIVGNGLSGIVQGILGGIGFALFGITSPLLWGSVLAFMAFLPIVGASIVFLPATAIMILHGKVGLAIGYLAYNVCYSSIIEYLVKPRVIGQGMQMNALLVFVGIIGGLKLFGILGIIYGPLIITVFLTLAEIYRLEYKESKA
jgi:predicted PurR-regulated permease PerM